MTENRDTAGRSARNRHEHLRANDQAKTRAAWGKLGGIAVALTPERSSTRVWATGAIGEEIVGARLDALASDQIRVLHDRRIPKSKANIDHIVVTPRGVWVIDTKRYVDKRIEKRVEGGLFSPRVEKLWVRGDQAKLLASVTRQVGLVEAAVPGLPVKGVLCFVDGDWPLFPEPFTVDGVLVLWPRKLSQLLAKEQGDVDVDTASAALARTFAAS
jgi:hypothetical protein